MAACPGSTLVYPDGTKHALLKFRRAGSNFVSTNADCLIESLAGDQRRMIDFLTSHFSDIAVGMVTDGSLEQLSHNGLRPFLSQVAVGEVVLGR